MTYTILVYEDKDEEGGGFWGSLAKLPDCFSTGDTVEELLENMKDAIATHLEALEAVGQPLPEPAVQKIELAIA
jgi:predicted RNase H-like HicB family nuclease